MPQSPDDGRDKPPPGPQRKPAEAPRPSSPTPPQPAPPAASAAFHPRPASLVSPATPPQKSVTRATRPVPPRPTAKIAAAESAPALDPTQITHLNALAGRLNTLDYFQILSLERTANPAEIKAAFHRWSRSYHPDRFYQLADKALKQRINEVYKRITEAYYILRDDVKRKGYLTDISGADRAQKLRFTEASEVETKAAIKKEHEEQIGTHPKGRQFFQSGMADFEAQRWTAAERNFKTALTFEPSNPRYKDKLAETQQKLHEEQRKSGGAFKIK